MAYSYKFQITLNKAQCGSADQTNFPVLIDLNNVGWATRTGVGALVINHNTQVVGGSRSFNVPTDLIFTSDAAGTTLLNWEWEDGYTDNAGGAVWVNIPTLNGSANSTSTVIWAFVGNAAVTTFQGNVTGTWNTAYKHVNHMGNGNTVHVEDSTNHDNGTPSGSPSTVSAKFGNGAISLATASSQFIDLSTDSVLNPTAITVSMWVKATSFPNSFNAVYCRGGANFAFYIDSSGVLHPFMAVTGSGSFLQYTGGGSGTHTLSTGTWYFVCIVYDSSVGLIGYVGASGGAIGTDGSAPANGTLDTTAIGSNNSYIGGDNLNGRYWNGLIDEVHISNVARSSDWITTEFNNTNNNGTFVTIGAQTPTTDLNSKLRQISQPNLFTQNSWVQTR